MKRKIVIIILISILSLAIGYVVGTCSFLDRFPSQAPKEKEITKFDAKYGDMSITAQTLTKSNNHFNWAGILVGALTVVVALYGLLGHRVMEKKIGLSILEEKNKLKSEIDEVLGNIKTEQEKLTREREKEELRMILVEEKEKLKKEKEVVDKIISEADEQIKMIVEKKEEIDKSMKVVNNLEKQIVAQEQYTLNSILFINESLTQLANKTSDNAILLAIFNNYQTTNLFSPENNKVFAALGHKEEYGTIKDIDSLEYVAKYNSDEKNKEKAREIIGMIKERTKREKEQTQMPQTEQQETNEDQEKEDRT